jgi:hypothetical protein
MEIDRCLREIAGIEAELLAGNPDVQGLCLALSDWHAELRILRDEEPGQHDEGKAENREAGGGTAAA